MVREGNNNRDWITATACISQDAMDGVNYISKGGWGGVWIQFEYTQVVLNLTFRLTYFCNTIRRARCAHYNELHKVYFVETDKPIFTQPSAARRVYFSRYKLPSAFPAGRHSLLFSRRPSIQAAMALTAWAQSLFFRQFWALCIKNWLVMKRHWFVSAVWYFFT